MSQTYKDASASDWKPGREISALAFGRCKPADGPLRRRARHDVLHPEIVFQLAY